MTLHVDPNRCLLARGLWIVAVCFAFVVTLVIFPASAAHAFGPPISDTVGPFAWYPCDQCHATAGEGTAWDGSGPHKGYSTTTSKCVVCHWVHASASPLLLRDPTVSQTCMTCHDGTASGIGPYDSIEAHGGLVAAEHTVEAATTIPGGSGPFSGTLNCGDCHSPHGTNTVQPFLRDGGYAFSWQEYVTSDCLLRNDVNGAALGAYTVYGAQWCASCHDQRHSDAAEVMNHPVNTAYDWGYGNVITTVTGTSLRSPNYSVSPNLAIGMGWTNAGYIMAPVAEAGDGHIRLEDRRDPMCQQCHEDARNVEAIFDADVYSPNTAPYVNPAFLTFPHQTTNQFMLAESYDDLCLNCHALASLP